MFSLPFRFRILGMFFSIPLLFPNFEKEFPIPFPIFEILKVNPAHPCWGWLLVLLYPCFYPFWVPPYIEEANNRSREVVVQSMYMVFCLSTISQQWIPGGGCTWYFVPLSTLTSHSRWSKKLRDTSSLWRKSPEKNFLLPPKGPFVSHLVRPSATDIKHQSIEEVWNINKTPPLCSTGLSLFVYNKNPLKTYTNLLFFLKS